MAMQQPTQCRDTFMQTSDASIAFLHPSDPEQTAEVPKDGDSVWEQCFEDL